MGDRHLLERSMISTKFSAVLRVFGFGADEQSTKLSPLVRELHPSVGNTFKDSYVLEFLGLPPVHSENELKKAGVLLCRDKDDEVVEYALSRNLSPTLIAQYQLQLPDKKLLQAKLHELFSQVLDGDDEAQRGGGL